MRRGPPGELPIEGEKIKVSYYPIFIELTGRPCLVIGGGPVAERKTDGLVAAGARVTVLSPALTVRLEELVEAGRIDHIGREYAPGDLAGYQFAFVATDDDDVNGAVAREGRERSVWVNASDDPAHCDFILPSILRRGELVVAVATGGGSPALSRAIREELEAYFTDDYSRLAELVTTVRQELRRRSRSPDPERWRSALTADLRRLVAEGKPTEAREQLLRRLLSEPG